MHWQNSKKSECLKVQQSKALNLPPWTLRLPTAANLARAALDTLAAEEQIAKLKVAEHEEHLAVLRDAAEAAHARVQGATLQIKIVLATLDSRGIHVDPPTKFNFEPMTLPCYDNLCHNTSDEGDFDSEPDEEVDGGPSESGSTMAE